MGEGLNEIITNKINGLDLEKNNCEQIIDKLKELINSDKKEQIVEEVSEDVKKEYNDLLNYKQQAEQEINQNGAGKQEAENDLVNIEKRINEILNIDEKNIEQKTKIQSEINNLKEKYDIKEKIEQEVVKEVEEQEVEEEVVKEVEEEVVEQDDYKKTEEVKVKAEEEAKLKAMQAVILKAEQEAKDMRATRLKAEQEARAKLQNQKIFSDKNIEIKDENLNIIYSVKKDMYELKSEDKNLTKWNRKNSQKSGNKFEDTLAETLKAYNIDSKIMKQIDPNLLAVVLRYDIEHKTEKISYVKELQKALEKGMDSKELKKYMKEVVENVGLHIEYDLRGLYDNIDGKGYSFSDDERWEILQRANKLKELGIANVRKGLKVSVMEKIENLIILIKKNKKQKLLDGKESYEETIDDLEGYDNLTNAEYLKSINKAFEESKREEELKRELNNKPKKQKFNFKGNLSKNISKVKNILNEKLVAKKGKNQELKERVKVSPEVQSYLDNIIKSAMEGTKKPEIHKLEENESEIVD